MSSNFLIEKLNIGSNLMSTNIQTIKVIKGPIIPAIE